MPGRGLQPGPAGRRPDADDIILMDTGEVLHSVREVLEGEYRRPFCRSSAAIYIFSHFFGLLPYLTACTVTVRTLWIRQLARLAAASDNRVFCNVLQAWHKPATMRGRVSLSGRRDAMMIAADGCMHGCCGGH